MRTKTIEVLIDRIFWALVLLMPIFAYVIINHHGSTDFLTVLNQFNILETNIIYEGIVMIFGSNGYIPFFDETQVNSILLYMSYFVFIEFIHIVVDVILFIPKICVEILDRYSTAGVKS